MAFPAPYNPQEWAPISSATGSPSPSAAGRFVHHRAFAGPDPDTPPPPYSPTRRPDASMAAAMAVAASAASATSASSPPPQSPVLSPHQRTTSTSFSAGGAASGRPYYAASECNRQHQRYTHSSRPSSSFSIPILPVVNRHHSPSTPRQLSPYQYPQNQPQHDQQPPAARRAASTGAIRGDGSAFSPPGRGVAAWEPGMPLPPPPPGPPPLTTSHQRDSSVGAATTATAAAAVPLRRRLPPRELAHQSPPAVGSTVLGSIPPTPANWVDSPVRLSADSGRRTDISPTTAAFPIAVRGQESLPPPQPPPSLSSVGPGSSTKGLRERRSQRREHYIPRELAAITTPTAASPASPALVRSERSWPQDLVLNSSATELRRRAAVNSSTTPRRDGTSTMQTAQLRSQPSLTPPFTPRGSSSFASLLREPATEQPSPPTSTQAPSRNSPGGIRWLPVSPPSASMMPPRLPMLNVRTSPPTPVDRSEPTVSQLSPAASPAPPVPIKSPILDRNTPTVGRQFIDDTVRRCRDFVEREVASASGTEAVKLFVDFIVAEANIRRRRYPTAHNLYRLDFCRGESSREERVVHGNSVNQSPVASSLASHSPARCSPINPSSASPWRTDFFQPSLSPIASMSTSDEMSSRGRTASRWWESQKDTDSAGNSVANEDADGAKISPVRLKREQKYMGVPRGMREAMESAPEQPPAATTQGSPDNTVEEGDFSGLDISRLVTLPPPYPRHYPASQNSHPDLALYRTTVQTVSDRTELESTKRAFHTESAALKTEQGSRGQTQALLYAEYDRYRNTVVEPLRQILSDRAAMVTGCLNQLQARLTLELGPLTNDDSNGSGGGISGTSVSNDIRGNGLGPLDQPQEGGDELPEATEQLATLCRLFEARERLLCDRFDLDAELAERYRAFVLWQYDATASESTETKAGSGERAMSIDNNLATDPTNQAKNAVLTFFARDSAARWLAHTASAAARHDSLAALIDGLVARAAEALLSAFWDVAPGVAEVVGCLPGGNDEVTGNDDDDRANGGKGSGGISEEELALCGKSESERGGQGKLSTAAAPLSFSRSRSGLAPPILDALSTLRLAIPATERTENPSYAQFPLQYLYTLLDHAERATRQLIRAHKAAWELANDVADARVAAHRELVRAEREVERLGSNQTGDSLPQGLKKQEEDEEAREETRLSRTPLEERVAMAEAQWEEGLGQRLKVAKRRVRICLEHQGGWQPWLG